MHLPAFWYDEESSFCIVKFGENLGSKQDLGFEWAGLKLLVLIWWEIFPVTDETNKKNHIIADALQMISRIKLEGALRANSKAVL
jgi:hypothetical protein